MYGNDHSVLPLCVLLSVRVLIHFLCLVVQVRSYREMPRAGWEVGTIVSIA